MVRRSLNIRQAICPGQSNFPIDLLSFLAIIKRNTSYESGAKMAHVIAKQFFPRKIIANAIPICVSAILITTATQWPARADVWSDAAGVVTDPLKLGKSADALRDFSASLQRTVLSLQKLEGQANVDVKERLNQINEIVNTVQNAIDHDISHIASVLEIETKAINDLEDKTYKDSIRFLDETQCVVEQVGADQVPRAVVDLREQVKEANPRILLFGFIPLFSLKVDPSDDLATADLKFESKKNKLLSDLNCDTTESSNAYQILSVYQNIEFAAWSLKCIFRKQEAENLRLTKEIADMERLSMPWVRVVTPVKE